MFKKYPITVLIFLFTLLYVKAAVASAMLADEAAAYASCIQTLVNNSSIKKKEGLFCIYGNDSVAKSLLRSTGNVVVAKNTIEAAHKCKAVYVSSESIVNLKSYLMDLAKHKILTISISDEFVENGGMIQVEMGRRNFELIVDVKALNSAQIKLDTLSTNLIIN